MERIPDTERSLSEDDERWNKGGNMRKELAEAMINRRLQIPGWHSLQITCEKGDYHVFEDGQELMDITRIPKSVAEKIRRDWFKPPETETTET